MNIKLCNFCNLSATNICSGCNKIYYCSKQCQVNDWLNHKLVCMNKSCFLIFMNSEYKDIWNICLDRLYKYGPKYIKIYAVVDNKELLLSYDNNNIINDIFEYDNNHSYNKRLNLILEQLYEKYVLLVHDSHILLNKVDDVKLKVIQNLMDEHNIHQVRLSKSGLQINTPSEFDILKKIDIHEYYQYSVYPSLLHINSFNNIKKMFIDQKYKECEIPLVQTQFKKLNNYFIWQDTCCHGLGVYPYPNIKLIHSGKWLITECENCNKIVYDLLKEYNINITSRKCSNPY